MGPQVTAQADTTGLVSLTHFELRMSEKLIFWKASEVTAYRTNTQMFSEFLNYLTSRQWSKRFLNEENQIEQKKKNYFKRYSVHWVEKCLPKGHAHPELQNVTFGNKVFIDVTKLRRGHLG